MQTINVINNIVLKDGILHAYGREGNREGNVTRVFLRQGNLEGRCAVYSLMMLLMLHGILNREDLLRKVSAKAPEYIKKLKGQFNHCTTRGYSLRELRIKLLRSFNNKIPVDVYVIRNRDKDNLKKIHDMIMAQIDIGYSVQLVPKGNMDILLLLLDIPCLEQLFGFFVLILHVPCRMHLYGITLLT